MRSHLPSSKDYYPYMRYGCGVSLARRKVRKLHPLFQKSLYRFAIVIVYESSQDGPSLHRPLSWLPIQRFWNLLPQALMRAGTVIILAVFSQGMILAWRSLKMSR
jgi:hypothetical protein